MPIARYRQRVDKLASEIREGRLAPGTATRVYAELQAMGLVSGETGRGTFARETALPRSLGIDQHATAIGMPDLNFNAPALSGQAELLRSALRQLAPVEIWRRCCAISRTEAGPMSELLSPCTLKTVG